MMASTDLNVIIASLQMAFTLMDKLPDVYRIQFRREGIHIWFSLSVVLLNEACTVAYCFAIVCCTAVECFRIQHTWLFNFQT